MTAYSSGMTKGQETRRANLAKKLTVQILDEREMKQLKRLTEEKALNDESSKSNSVRVYEAKERPKTVVEAKAMLPEAQRVQPSAKVLQKNISVKTRYIFEP